MSLFNSRLIASLLSVSALAFGIYSVFDAQQLSTQQKSSRLDHVFVSFPFDEIQEIFLKTEKKELRLRQEGGEFFVQELSLEAPKSPVALTSEFKADPLPLRQLKTSLSQLSWRRTLLTPPPLSQLGLQQPRLELEVHTTRGLYRLKLGSKSLSPADTLYAQLEAVDATAMVGVIDADLLNDLSLDAQTYAGTRLLNVGKKRTLNLTIKRPEDILDFQRDENGFHFKAGGERVERELSDLLFLQLARTSVEKFLEPKAEQNELFRNNIEIRQTADDGSEQILIFGSTCPGSQQLVAVQLKGTRSLTGCAPALALGALKLPRDRFIDRSLAPLRPDEVDRAQIIEEKQRFDLIRKEGAFEILEPKSSPLSLAEGNNFLGALLSTQGELIATSDPRIAAWDHSQPLVTIRLKSPLYGQALLLEVVERSPKSGVTLRRANGDYLNFTSANSWPFSAQALWARSKLVLDLKPEMLLSIAIESQAVNETISYGEALQFAPPLQKTKVDRNLADYLRRSLSHLEAARWLPLSEVPAVARATAQIIVKIRSKAGAYKLTIGPEVPGGRLARLGEQKEYFVLSGVLLDLLAISHADRSPAQLDLNTAEKAAVEGPHAQLLFKRTASGLRVTQGQSFPNQGQRVLELCQSLTALYRIQNKPAVLGRERLSITSDGRKIIFFAPQLVNGRVLAPAYLPALKLYFYFAETSVANLSQLL